MVICQQCDQICQNFKVLARGRILNGQNFEKLIYPSGHVTDTLIGERASQWEMKDYTNISFSELRFACFEHSDWLLKSLQPIRALKASVASFCVGDYLNIMGPWEAWIKNCHCTLLH